MNCCPLRASPRASIQTPLLDLPHNIRNVYSCTCTHTAGQVGAAVPLDLGKAKAGVQLTGFQRVNEKGNSKIEGVCVCGGGRRRMKESRKELLAKKLPLLQPLAGRRSPLALLVWSGAPSHSQTIGINPGSGGPGAPRCQTARAPSAWSALTQAALHPPNTHLYTHTALV